MQIRRFARWVGSLSLILGLTACVVHDTPPVNPGYGYYGPQSYGPGYGPPPGGGNKPSDVSEAPGNGAVGKPTPNNDDSMPPKPLYEQMSPSRRRLPPPRRARRPRARRRRPGRIGKVCGLGVWK